MFDSNPSYYKVQNISEIEDFGEDQYGNKWFNVKFEDSSETYLWLAKEAPEENKSYYGHFEKTKSGSRMRFKRDKEPKDLISYSQGSDKQYDKSRDITLGMVWKIVAQIRGLPENDDDFAKFFEIVDAHLNELIHMSDKLK